MARSLAAIATVTTLSCCGGSDVAVTSGPDRSTPSRGDVLPSVAPVADRWFESFAVVLDGLGVWGRLPGGDAARAAFVAEQEGGWWWRADGEDLADGGVALWLAEMVDAIGAVGLTLEVDTIRDPWGAQSDGYTVAINGEAVVLYDFVDGEPGLPSSDDPWFDCTVLPLAVVNRLLTGSGSDHRLVVLDAGANDGIVMLLPQLDAARLLAVTDEGLLIPT